MKKKSKKTYIIIMLLAIGFVLTQSMLNAEISSVGSKNLAKRIYEYIVEISGHEERSIDQIELILRKLAHFVEYFFMSTIVLIGVQHLVKKKWAFIIIVLLVTIPIPFLDELFIQASTDGRSPHYLDIGIDMAGIFMSYIVYVLYWIMDELSISK